MTDRHLITPEATAIGDIRGRHPGTQHFAEFFEFDHLPEGLMRNTSENCAGLAAAMVHSLSDGPELTAGLRHLLEAKDAFVRQAKRTLREYEGAARRVD